MRKLIINNVLDLNNKKQKFSLMAFIFSMAVSFIIIYSIYLLSAYYSKKKDKEILSEAETTYGEVIRKRYTKARCIDVKFTAINKEYIDESCGRSVFNKYSVGSFVLVKYKRTDPTKCIIE